MDANDGIAEEESAVIDRYQDPEELRAEDCDTDRLVERAQAGDREAFGTVYSRYFDRVHSYMKVLIKDTGEAEDATQQVFLKALEALPRYRRRAQPFRAWLFAIARNCALDQIAELSRVELLEDAELTRHRERAAARAGHGEDPQLRALGWVSDPDLMIFIDRLTLVQQQVLLLRYTLDLSYRQIGEILDRREDDVRALQYRALKFLRARLIAIGREPTGDGDGESNGMQRAADKANVIRARRFALL